jgi:hypothetical protein
LKTVVNPKLFFPTEIASPTVITPASDMCQTMIFPTAVISPKVIISIIINKYAIFCVDLHFRIYFFPFCLNGKVIFLQIV